MRDWLVVLSVMLALAACDQRRIEKLEEGVATENDVRRQFGAPYAVAVRPDGSRVLEYPRQPEGATNYEIVIGPDGKMSSLRQLLTPANFAKVTPGMPKTQVMDLLGKAAKTQHFSLKDQEIWDWRFMDGVLAKVFSVTFDNQGHVVSTAITEDLRDITSGAK